MKTAGNHKRDEATVDRLGAELGERRLSLEEWLRLLPSGEDVTLPLAVEDDELFALADGRRRELHPDGIVTYIIDRNISYTNVCTSICNFCAFYRSPGEEGGYVLSYDEIFSKVEERIIVSHRKQRVEQKYSPPLWTARRMRSIYGCRLQVAQPGQGQ